ncbi:protein split ends-like [Asterias rubens]|uniref:protein split ends-like n=1 Tax=Asterias rubens TaxID=7604 RepID=UPI00145501DD|nr:protein split ends-like [Asterias rubens]
MLSSLAKGCGSWRGDLEATGTRGKQKAILCTGLGGEDTKFLEKSVNIPLRIKSAAVTRSSTASSERDQLANAIKAKTPKTEYSRPKSVCSISPRPKTPREKRLRSKSAAVILSPRSKNTSSSATFAKYGSKFNVSAKHTSSREVNSRKSLPSEVKCQRSDGQLELPKTFMTRKGALMLFTAPENLNFSSTDQKCFYKSGKEETDVSKLSLTLGTVNKLTSSVLGYGNQQIEAALDSDQGSREKTHMQFIHDDLADQENVDYRAQPGADFVFYLRDMQSRAVVRNLIRTPSQQSLLSVDSTAELTAAFQTIDPRGSTEGKGPFPADVKRLAGSQRWNVSSAGSIRQHSRNAHSRPSTSASGRSTSLSVEKLAASLKSSPYLGHPLSAPYPPNCPPSPEFCQRHGSPLSRHSLASARSRHVSSAHSVRSHRSSRVNGFNEVEGDNASQGSFTNLSAAEYAQERMGSEGAFSTPMDDEAGSFHGNSVRTGGLSPGLSYSEVDISTRDDVVGDNTSHGDALSSHQDEMWNQDPQPYSPVRNNESRPTSSVSRHTFISGTTSVPTTVQDGQQDNLGMQMDGQFDHDVLLVDQNALLLEISSDHEDGLDALQESANSGQWPVMDSTVMDGNDRLSPGLSPARLRSPDHPQARSLSRPGSEARSLSPRLQVASPALSNRSTRSQEQVQFDSEEQTPDFDGAETQQLPVPGDQEMPTLPSKSPSPVPSERVPDLQPKETRPRSGIPTNQQGLPPSNATPSSTPRLPPRKADLGDVVNRVAEKEMGVPYTTLVPPKLGPSGDQRTKTRASPERQSPSPTPQEVKPDAKPPTPTKKISKLDLGKLKTMVKPAEAKSKSPKVGRKSKGKGVRPKSSGVQFIDSLKVDSYEGPSEDEVEKMVQEELSKELELSQLTEGEESQLLAVPEEKADDAVSLGTDDEALEREIKKQSQQGKKKTKKQLAKEKAELKEARQQEKLRLEEEKKALKAKKKQKEKERRQQEIAEQRRIQMAKEELEDAAWEAERAAEAEEEARQMLQESRKLAREEREARRKADAEKKKQEKEKQRQERRKMEEAARQREQEMAERLAGAAEKRKLREEAEWERQERERMEQEEREQEEEEEKRRQEEEEEKIREMEREAEEEALTRLVREREEAESRMRQARQDAEKQRQEEERLRLEEEKKKDKEAERQRLLEEEAEKKRQEELERIKRIQRIEEEARERVRKELARRKTWALRRREHNQGQRDHLNGMRQTQGMTRPWVFSYYVHWPKENYEKRIFVAKKKQFRARPKPKPLPEAGPPAKA